MPHVLEKVPWAKSYRNNYVSHLRLSENASTPNLEMQYPPPQIVTLPTILDMLTIRPLVFLINGKSLRVRSMGPSKFTSITLLKSSFVNHSLGAPGIPVPALFTNPHRPIRKNKRNIRK